MPKTKHSKSSKKKLQDLTGAITKPLSFAKRRKRAEKNYKAHLKSLEKIAFAGMDLARANGETFAKRFAELIKTTTKFVPLEKTAAE